jgi:hypothetical protein
VTKPATCPICGEPLTRDFCWACDEDARQQRRERGAWHAYINEYKEKMGAIAEAAQRVCDERELELIGGDLLEWPEQRLADHLGLSPAELRTMREQTHEKIRDAIGQETVTVMAQRRRYQTPPSRG